ncbi:peptidylprolyl isomerase [Bordetella petrii]|nr:peptidylprolyl isomerase [Bordetella petrii]
MKFKRTQVALAVGGLALIGAGFAIGTWSSGSPSALPEAQAVTHEAPGKAVATSDAEKAGDPEVAASANSPAVARLGNLAVGQEEVTRLLRNLPQATRAQLKEDRSALDQWLRTRLAEEALLAEAQRQGWKERPEVKELAQAAERQVVLQTYLDEVSQVAADYPSDKELQAAYDANKVQWTSPAQYRVSQIFLAAPYQDAEAVAKVRKHAADIAKKARAKGADFTALVKEYSQDEATAAQEGDTGWAPLQQLVPEIRATVAALDKGAVSEPVQSQAGFHVLKLADFREQTTPELGAVREQLRQALRRQRKAAVAQAYLKGLVDAGTLSIDGASLRAAFDAAQ